MFLPSVPGWTSHFINMYLIMVFQYLESTLHTLAVATSDKRQTSFQVVRNNLCLDGMHKISEQVYCQNPSPPFFNKWPALLLMYSAKISFKWAKIQINFLNFSHSSFKDDIWQNGLITVQMYIDLKAKTVVSYLPTHKMCWNESINL